MAWHWAHRPAVDYASVNVRVPTSKKPLKPNIIYICSGSFLSGFSDLLKPNPIFCFAFNLGLLLADMNLFVKKT